MDPPNPTRTAKQTAMNAVASSIHYENESYASAANDNYKTIPSDQDIESCDDLECHSNFADNSIASILQMEPSSDDEQTTMPSNVNDLAIIDACDSALLSEIPTDHCDMIEHYMLHHPRILTPRTFQIKAIYRGVFCNNSLMFVISKKERASPQYR